MLRNPEDDAPLGEGAMNVAKLLGIETPPAPAAPKRVVRRAPPPPGIEYIIGGS